MYVDQSAEFWPTNGASVLLCVVLGLIDLGLLLQFLFRVLPRFFH